jgi:hypothetical protein
MTRRSSTFRQIDITRAIKATVAAGLQVTKVEVGQDGRIIVVPGNRLLDDVQEPLPKHDIVL